MKAKRVLIIYGGNFSIEEVSSTEKMFAQIIDEMANEGRAVKTLSKGLVVFDDGSRVEKVLINKFISDANRAIRANYVFVNESILNIVDKERLLNIISPIVSGKSFQDGEPSSDKLFVFNKNEVKRLLNKENE